MTLDAAFRMTAAAVAVAAAMYELVLAPLLLPADGRAGGGAPGRQVPSAASSSLLLLLLLAVV